MARADSRLVIPQDTMETVWSFDLGKASIGEAVRNLADNSFPHKASLLIPHDFAETRTAANRRRMWRTRIAHKEREKWLDTVMREVGIEPLQKRAFTQDGNGKWHLAHPADERLEREFAPAGDVTSYTSCLLRIKLLRGEPLEPWQVYKALHSAIQRRGYDPDIPWKARESRRRRKADDAEEEKGTRERMEKFVETLKEMAPGKPEFHFACYYDAWKMGLWNPAEPEHLRERIDCHAQSTHNQIVPRRLMEKEIRALVEAAAKQVPALSGKADYILYGPAQKAYASYDPELREKYDLREGGASDWQGVLGQKVPRFDNRIIGKCVLIPRMNVCKIKADEKGHPLPESLLAVEVLFLMKLKNMRVQRSAVQQTGLTATELRNVFENPKLHHGYKITKTQWKSICGKIGARPVPGHEEVEAIKVSGRSRFCRPALDILKRLILSGQSPLEFYKAELLRLNGNTDSKRGLVPEDLKFLTQMGDTWEGIYIPNQKLDALVRNSEDRDAAIRELIGAQNDPIVRHRLSMFAERLSFLEEQFGKPKEIVLEFVREDFMGEKAKLEYRKFLKDRARQRSDAREDAAKVGTHERAAGLKLELLRAQGGICLYTGETLAETKLDEYEIDHIVPRSKGGPDAAVNYVLTTHHTNHDLKGEKTPFEWLSAANGWDAYVNRVRSRETALRNKKVKLLTSPDAVELAGKYTALAETAWIAKLSQAIIALHFGWRGGTDDNRRRVAIVNGGLTARVRRKYKLNSLLNPDAKGEEEAEKKNRDDDRHHALDAMVISFIPGWMRDPAKEHFFRFPPEIHRNAREFFGHEIEQVIPLNICFEKPMLAETIYGARGKNGDKVIVQRAEVLKLAYKQVNPSKSVYDLAYAEKQTKAVRDLHIRQILLDFIHEEPPEEGWKQFCETLCLRQRDGLPGSRITHVRMNVGEPVEYKDLSKDGTGAYRKAKKGHKGQIVYLDENGKPRVRPIYVFESEAATKHQLMRDGHKIVGFFQSLCSVEITGAVEHPKTPLSPGKYNLNTIRKDGFVVLTDASGHISQPISLSKLLNAGFKRVD
jgi:CRISPR-associated endonuclease Csn1